MILEPEPIIDHFAKEAFRRFSEAVGARSKAFLITVGARNIRSLGTAEVEALARLDVQVERERRRWKRWYRVYCSAHNMAPLQ